MQARKIIVSRHDKLGDFMLAWPALAMLKQSLKPKDEVWVLAANYTADVARSCPWVDGVIVDYGDAKRLVKDLKAESFNAVIALFSDWYIAKVLRAAKIPYRLAPATKVAQILYTHRLTQRRSRSLKAEYEYNLDLARHFLQSQDLTPIIPETPYWPLEVSKKSQTDTKQCFLHACNGGSSENLSHAQYLEFCQAFTERFPEAINWTLTHGPNELEKIQPLKELLDKAGLSVEIAPRKDSITSFAYMLAENADVFIASSTGTLHLAAALDIPTVSFYPRKTASNKTRWQTINSPSRRVAFSPDMNVEVEDEKRDIMGTIDMKACGLEAAQALAKLYNSSNTCSGLIKSISTPPEGGQPWG